MGEKPSNYQLNISNHRTHTAEHNTPYHKRTRAPREVSHDTRFTSLPRERAFHLPLAVTVAVAGFERVEVGVGCECEGEYKVLCRFGVCIGVIRMGIKTEDKIK